MTSRKERQAAHNRKMILEAAARVLVRGGLEGLTIEAIATEADYSPAALYKYFKNKMAIFHELLAYVGECLMEEIGRPSVRPPTFRGDLLHILESAFRFATERSALFEALLIHAPRGELVREGGLHRTVVQMDLSFIEHLEKLMQRGIEAGELRPGSALDYAWAMRGLLQAFLMRWHCTSGDGRSFAGARDHEALVDLFLNGAGTPQAR